MYSETFFTLEESKALGNSQSRDKINFFCEVASINQGRKIILFGILTRSWIPQVGSSLPVNYSVLFILVQSWTGRQGVISIFICMHSIVCGGASQK
jgi:hypothetical protein